MQLKPRLRKVDLQDAVDIFLDSPDILPIYTVKKGDYAVQIQEDQHLYLIFETRGRGIVMGKLPPDLVRLIPVEDEEAHYEAQSFMMRRLKEAGLA